jgi:hypothetical protein
MAARQFSPRSVIDLTMGDPIEVIDLTVEVPIPEMVDLTMDDPQPMELEDPQVAVAVAVGVPVVNAPVVNAPAVVNPSIPLVTATPLPPEVIDLTMNDTTPQPVGRTVVQHRRWHRVYNV